MMVVGRVVVVDGPLDGVVGGAVVVDALGAVVVEVARGAVVLVTARCGTVGGGALEVGPAGDAGVTGARRAAGAGLTRT
jgi:hypothetical protein